MRSRDGDAWVLIKLLFLSYFPLMGFSQTNPGGTLAIADKCTDQQINCTDKCKINRSGWAPDTVPIIIRMKMIFASQALGIILEGSFGSCTLFEKVLIYLVQYILWAETERRRIESFQFHTLAKRNKENRSGMMKPSLNVQEGVG